MPTTTEDAKDLERAIGLCTTCVHRRTQTTRRGAHFYRCARADEDARFLRYPPIPVTRCPGHERPPGDGADSKPRPGA